MMTSLEDKTSLSQRVASDPQKSAWVSANAGSGKTHVLVNRIIRLMLDGAEPGKILALTFTKAAAAEMANRLNQRLAGWAMLTAEALRQEVANITGAAPSPDQLIRARRLFAHALETPGGLKIQTIHAFCERILHRFALEANVAPNFEILDDRTAAELLNEAREQVFSTLDDDRDAEITTALKIVSGALSAADFDGLITQVLKHRTLLRGLHHHLGGMDEVEKKLRQTFGLNAEDEHGTLLAEAIGPASLIPERLGEFIAYYSAGLPTDAKKSQALRTLRDTSDPDQRYGLYKSLFFKKDGGPFKSVVTKTLIDYDPLKAKFLEDEQMRLDGIGDKLKSLRIADNTGSLLRIADKILGVYEAEKTARALLDYDDLIVRTAHLLSQDQAAAWVLYKLDNGIDHILVDEAQDTSPEQWQVISALSDEFFAGAGAHETLRTIFAVGDEKQSIFGFQGANPEEFDRMRRHFQRRAGFIDRAFESVPLTVSFRSTGEILAAVDRVFSQPQAAQGMTSLGEACIHEAFRQGQQGLIEIWPTEKPEDEQPSDPWTAPLDYPGTSSPGVILAGKIAATIKGWIDNKEILEPRGRPIRPSDILILVRRRNNFVDAMVEALKKADIPVAGIDRMYLSQQLAVMDLLSLARFALLADDDLNLAVVLKGPLFGFNDDQLFALAHGRKSTLWRSLAAQKSQDALFAEAHDALSKLLGRADKIPPFEFFAQILNADNGRRKFIGRLGIEANDPIDEFLSLCLDFESSNTPSLQGFIAWFGAADVEAKRDMEHGRDEVRVMTVHGAKGLEANIVILPDTCHRVPDPRKQPKILTTPIDGRPESPLEMLIWRPNKNFENHIVEQGLEREKTAEIEEYNRILYVAMTRARDRLYITGYEGKQPPSPRCWYNLISNELRPQADEILDAHGNICCWRISGEQKADVFEPSPIDHLAAQAKTPPVWARQPAAAEVRQMDLLSPSHLSVHGAEPQADQQSALTNLRPSPLQTPPDERYLRGRLIHKLLEYAPGAVPDTYAEFCRNFLQRSAPSFTPETRDSMTREVLRVIENSEFSPLFDSHGLSEVPIVGQVHVAPENKMVKVLGRIDRLIIKSGEVLAIDFKTDRTIAAGPEAIPPAYKKQMALYRHLLAQVFPDRNIRCQLFWTAGPTLMELPEEILKSALQVSG